METQQKQCNDLYLTLAPNHDTKHLLRSNSGAEGFEDFIRTDTQFLLNEAIVPDIWMFHYHFSEEQTRDIKAISGLRNRDYFRNLLPSLLEQGISPVKIHTMDEAAVLRLSDIPLNKIINKEFDLALVCPPFKAYVAVDTAQGVLLFTPTQEGNRLFEGYMQHLADTFFMPPTPQNYVSISKIPAFDPALKPFVNQCPKFSKASFNPRKEINIAPEIFAPKMLVKDAVYYRTYDMNPRWENFCQFVFPIGESGLRCTQQNYDIMRLQHTAQTGKILFPWADTLPHTFNYIKNFSDLLAQGIADKDSLIARARATNLLESEFPDLPKISEQHTLAENQPSDPYLIPDKHHQGVKF